MAVTLGIEYKIGQNTIAIESDLGTVEVEQEGTEIADITRTEQTTVTVRAEDIERAITDSTSIEDEENTETSEGQNQNENESSENSESQEIDEIETENYIQISDVTISQSMDLTIRTGLSRQDFITLIAGVKQDTSGFFEENAGLIYDLCEEYSLNEIFFCGIISAESGWNIASNHRSTHNYISLMSNGKLISYSSVESGLTEAARVLHTNYLSPGGKYYYGKTLSAVKTKFCPSSSTWVSLVYGRMKQILN